jgi:hypothetical protein
MFEVISVLSSTIKIIIVVSMAAFWAVRLMMAVR